MVASIGVLRRADLDLTTNQLPIASWVNVVMLRSPPTPGAGWSLPGLPEPFLTWHHFDPPYNVRPHNDPKGMIALCEHDGDGGSRRP